MDRAKKDKLPEMQVGFIDGVCLPIYQVGFNLNKFCLCSDLQKSSKHPYFLG